MVRAHAQPCFCQSQWREWGWGKRPSRITEIQRVGMHKGREEGREGASVWGNGLWL